MQKNHHNLLPQLFVQFLIYILAVVIRYECDMAAYINKETITSMTVTIFQLVSDDFIFGKNISNIIFEWILP